MTLLISLGLLALHTEAHIFSADENTLYELKKPLEVGDVTRAWGVFKDDSTSKFSVTIGQSSSKGPVLLVADFRPWSDLVILNSYDERKWEEEIRPRLGRHNFDADTMFEVKIEVHTEGYRVFLNGNELERRFPHRLELSRGEHVELKGGSNGFQWTALHLPTPEGGTVSNTNLAPGPGIPFATTTGQMNSLSLLERPLAPGDVLTAWGIYATGSAKFSFNLMMENGLYHMINVDFRPPPGENKVVMNSKNMYGWQTELRTDIPTFQNGKPFKVAVKCLEDAFQVFVDGTDLGTTFPYREGFALREIKFLWLLGGSQGMIWTDAQLPKYESFRHIFSADKNVEYGFKKPLEVGDVVRAWGVFQDDTTSRFSVSIESINNAVVFVADFRPWDDLVVLNSFDSMEWQEEIRLEFSKNNFEKDTVFEIKIQVEVAAYQIFFNGKELNQRFPHRVDMKRGHHVVLNGGSHGFQWTALHLPNGQNLGPGIPFEATSGKRNIIKEPLAPYDVINAWGIYADGSVGFTFGFLMQDEDHYMLSAAFNPPPNGNKALLNSKDQSGWETEVKTNLPEFANGEPFKVEIKCLSEEFRISVNGKALEMNFPYRAGFVLSEVKYILLGGGSAGMQWTDLALPWYSDSNSLNWIKFSETKQAVIKPYFEQNTLELYFLRLPCEVNMWFKLGLRRYGGLNAHVEIKGQRGSIYCDRADNVNWFNGETTRFNLLNNLECRPGEDDVILIIEKTSERITLKKLGRVIYNQVFTEKDGYCHSSIPSTWAWTNLQRHPGYLELAVSDSRTDRYGGKVGDSGNETGE